MLIGLKWCNNDEEEIRMHQQGNPKTLELFSIFVFLVKNCMLLSQHVHLRLPHQPPSGHRIAQGNLKAWMMKTID